MVRNESATSHDSLQEFYTLFAEQFNERDSWHTMVHNVGWVVGIVAVVLIVATIFVYIIQWNHRKQIAEAGDSKQKQEYYGIDEDVLAYAPEHEEKDKTGAVAIAGAMIFLTFSVLSAGYGIHQLFTYDSAPEQRTVLAETAEQIQETAITHILEDYTVTAVEGIEEPYENTSRSDQRRYQNTMADWAQRFYHSSSNPLTVQVQLEDHGNTIYTYRLWYDKDTDRAQLLDAPFETTEDTAHDDHNAPDVATLERGD